MYTYLYRKTVRANENQGYYIIEFFDDHETRPNFCFVFFLNFVYKMKDLISNVLVALRKKKIPFARHFVLRVLRFQTAKMTQTENPKNPGTIKRVFFFCFFFNNNNRPCFVFEHAVFKMYVSHHP